MKDWDLDFSFLGMMMVYLFGIFGGDLCVCGVYMCACVCVGGVMNPCASTEVQREHHSQPYFLKMGSIIEPGARSGAGSQQSQ